MSSHYIAAEAIRSGETRNCPHLLYQTKIYEVEKLREHFTSTHHMPMKNPIP